MYLELQQASNTLIRINQPQHLSVSPINNQQWMIKGLFSIFFYFSWQMDWNVVTGTVKAYIIIKWPVSILTYLSSTVGGLHTLGFKISQLYRHPDFAGLLRLRFSIARLFFCCCWCWPDNKLAIRSHGSSHQVLWIVIGTDLDYCLSKFTKCLSRQKWTFQGI